MNNHLVAFDELPAALFEALHPLLGYETANVATDEILYMITDNTTPQGEGEIDWKVRMTFHADAYETDEMTPADLAISTRPDGIEVRQMPETDLWYSHRGWKIGDKLCEDVYLGDGYTLVIAVERR